MLLVIAVGLVVAGIIVRELVKSKEKTTLHRLPLVLFILAGVSVLLSTLVIIPTGSTGVKSSMGQIQDKVIPTGVAFQIPLVQTIEVVSNKRQDVVIDTQVWAESQDKVQVYGAQFYITYQINPEHSARLLSTVSNYRIDLVNASMVTSAFKDATASLSSKEVTVRGKVEPLTQQALQEKADDKYGENVLFINQVIVSDMNFEDSYNEAIAQRNQAQLHYEKAQIVNQTAIETAEAQKKVTETNANAKAQARVIEATAQAEANRLLAQSITPEVLAYLEMQARMKHGWVTIQGASTALVTAGEGQSSTNQYEITAPAEESQEGTVDLEVDYGE